MHIPFCKRKCSYCHFYVVPDRDALKDLLLPALLQELQSTEGHAHFSCCRSIYFGGGTPSLFGAKRIAQILEKIRSSNHFISAHCEVTLEANPESFSLSLAKEYASVGINRISIGVQSFDETLLQKISRQHSAKQAIEAVENCAHAGIENISIDLMYDLPYQTIAHWRHSLHTAASLPISHLSLYNLSIEPSTAFFRKKNQIAALQPNEEESRQMYFDAVDILQEQSLMQYEISAFARNGRHSLHNTGYWTGRPFLGLGPSAFSYWQGRRFRNIANLYQYNQAVSTGKSAIDFTETLSPDAQRRELFVLQLRLLEGVDLMLFEKKHGALSPDTYCAIETLVQQDLLHFSKENVALTEKGKLFYDTVASDLI